MYVKSDITGDSMSFPISDYDKAVAALRATVADRDANGRNETNDFYNQFPHGNQDLTFELARRVQRILGAEKLGKMDVVYNDTLDLANYAIFSMMLLSKDSDAAVQAPAQTPEKIPPDFVITAQGAYISAHSDRDCCSTDQLHQGRWAGSTSS